jgi:hypothetical protein
MMVMNGGRLFMVGSYQLLKTTELWNEMQAAGFKLIRTGANRGALDQARAPKMYAWGTRGSIDPAKRAESDARFCEKAEGFNRHPALLYWETEDAGR